MLNWSLISFAINVLFFLKIWLLLQLGLPEPLSEQSSVINNRQSELAYNVSQLIEVVSVGVSKLNQEQN